ncbi:hypothetical protein KIW_00380 [Pediococcus acidilactici MA18/5M]|nr:hypothetical protein KIW_00380 [Pediococcus acidilactici MA18/5M]
MILSEPLVGFNKVVNIRRIVVFPAPLGPSKANTSPRLTLKKTCFTALWLPYVLFKLLISIAYLVLMINPPLKCLMIFRGPDEKYYKGT